MNEMNDKDLTKVTGGTGDPDTRRVSCPDCREVFEVGIKAKTAICPGCKKRITLSALTVILTILLLSLCACGKKDASEAVAEAAPAVESNAQADENADSGEVTDAGDFDGPEEAEGAYDPGSVGSDNATSTTGFGTEEAHYDYDEPFGEQVPVDAATRKKMNIFLSNFSEAGMFEYDMDHTDLRKIYDWVHIWYKINKWQSIVYEQRPGDDVYSTCETLTLDDLNKVTDRYLGFTESDAQAAAQMPDSPDSSYRCFYVNGRLYAPAADGESYTMLTIISGVEDLGNQRLKIKFNLYSQDLDAYFEGVDKAAYYVLSDVEAAGNPELEIDDAGYAVVRVDGSSYKLEHMELY